VTILEKQKRSTGSASAKQDFVPTMEHASTRPIAEQIQERRADLAFLGVVFHTGVQIAWMESVCVNLACA